MGLFSRSSRKEDPEHLIQAAREAVGSLPPEKAISLASHALEASKYTFGWDHPWTINARRVLADAYLSARDGEHAVQLLEPLVAHLTAALGAEDEYTFDTREDLVFALGIVGDEKTLLDASKSLLADSEHVFGDDDPRTMTARANLASAYQGAREWHRAAELARRVLHDYEATLDGDDSRIMTASLRLASIDLELGEEGEAREMFERGIAIADKLEARDVAARARAELAQLDKN